MLLKISLSLAILIGLATLWLTHDRLGGKIEGLNGQVATLTTEKQQAQDARAKAADEAKKAKANFETAAKELKDATNFLSQVTRDLDVQRKRANDASSNLVTVTEERNLARQELNKWEIIGLPPERVMGELQAKKALEGERTVLLDEKKIFSKSIQDLKRRLGRYETTPEPEVPAGTKGKVVAYDPKYEFVVLDIGANQGLVPDAKLLINREGKFVTKVKITHVEPNRAIANVMPEWGKEEVLEGDLAISIN